MIFPIGLKVLSQMLNRTGEKCDLHIRAAGIFVMQLKLLEAQRFTALCHDEVATLEEEPILATAHHASPAESVIIPLPVFRVCRRTTGGVSPASAPHEDRRRPL